MKVQTYKGDNIRKLLDNAPYEWRATGTYGIEKVLKNGYQTSTFMIYVNNKDLDKWQEYLTSKSTMPTNILANLNLIGVNKLPNSSYQNSNVVDLGKLVKDIYQMAPRYRETHPEVMRYLKEKRDVA